MKTADKETKKKLSDELEELKKVRTEAKKEEKRLMDEMARFNSAAGVFMDAEKLLAQYESYSSAIPSVG